MSTSTRYLYHAKNTCGLVVLKELGAEIIASAGYRGSLDSHPAADGSLDLDYFHGGQRRLFPEGPGGEPPLLVAAAEMAGADLRLGNRRQVASTVLKKTQFTLDLELAPGRRLSNRLGLYLCNEYFLSTRYRASGRSIIGN